MIITCDQCKYLLDNGWKTRDRFRYRPTLKTGRLLTLQALQLALNLPGNQPQTILAP